MSESAVIQKKVVPLHRFFDVTYGRKKSCLAMLRETITNSNHKRNNGFNKSC